MTQEEIKTGLCNLQTRFQDILFKPKNQSTDGIPNLSDIKESNPKNRANLWKSTNNYKIGDIAIYNNVAYISKTDNSNEFPENNTTNWTKLNNKGLLTGDFFISAYIVLQTMNVYANDYSDLNIELNDSFNINSVYYLGDNIFKVNISDNAGLVNSDYLVIESGTPKYNGTNNITKYKSTIIFNKTTTGFYIKIPFVYGVDYISLAIIPKQ